MTELEKMWAALEAHQHIADKKGYGEAWARMCSKRTRIAAATAAYVADAAYSAVDAVDAVDAALAAADALAAANAVDAVDAAFAAAVADRNSKRAIAHITKANGEQS